MTEVVSLNKKSRKDRKRKGKRNALLAVISFAMIMTVLTIASDFLDVIMWEYGWGALVIVIIITFAFFCIIYEYGLKRSL